MDHDVTTEASSALARLAERYWDYELETAPTKALFIGDYRNVADWEDPSRHAEMTKAQTLLEFADVAEALSEAELDAADRITRAMLIEEARQHAVALEHSSVDFDVDPTAGFHISILQMAGQIPLPTEAEAAQLVVKWSRFGAYFDGIAARLREGIARGRTASHTAVIKTLAQIDSYLESDIGTDPYALVPAPESMNTEDVAEWRTRMQEQVQFSIRPGYQRYRDVLAHEVLPHARSDNEPGVVWLDGGPDLYRAAARRHTTLDLAPEEVHQIGLDCIDSLEAEYRELGAKVFGTADVGAIYERLRTDTGLRFEAAADVRDAAQASLERARAAMGDWFGLLPVAGCVMVELDGPGAEQAPLGYYLSPSIDGSRPGSFFINTSEPTTRTRYESEPLAFHESIPGHHLQLAIAQELDGIPEFRKHATATAYVEGWGLYTERLADEMGLYTSDVARFGVLSFDSWRSGRLVVDTGLHALGWSRQQAIDYLMENSPQALNNIENEVDRYIAWPGQALAYKIGQREILRLRAEAERRRGDQFDIKKFHDTVLDSGPVTLGILGDLVLTWASQ